MLHELFFSPPPERTPVQQNQLQKSFDMPFPRMYKNTVLCIF
jgi:hypothetical protein